MKDNILFKIKVFLLQYAGKPIKTSTNCNGHRYRCSPNIPPSLNGSHSLFLVDYKIYIEYIYYK